MKLPLVLHLCACVFSPYKATHLQNRTHGVCGGSSEVGAELVESLQVGLTGQCSNNRQTILH